MRLKLLLVLSALLMLVTIVAGFSVLSAHFFVRGMDTIVAGQMESAARRYLGGVTAGTPHPASAGLATVEGYAIATDWAQMPATIRAVFAAAPVESGVLDKYEDAPWFGRPQQLHFVLRYCSNDQTYFIARTMTPADASAVVGRSAKRSLQLLTLVGAGTLLALGLLLWLLSRRINQPLNALVQWTRHLDATQLRQPPPAFGFPELNEMAGLIRSSLATVQDSLEREHQFQRHVSHELRTPISVVRSNINLLRRLEQQRDGVTPAQLGPIVDRIDRASLTMKNLTHTLLWLSRTDSDETLPTATVQLDQLLRTLADECSYLLRDKAVQVQIDTAPCALELAPEPARIVLANIIQNAFQHTWEGEVQIRQQGNRVEVINHNRHRTDAIDDLGFGLGLRLIAELTTRLGWNYTNEPRSSGHRVSISFPVTPP